MRNFILFLILTISLLFSCAPSIKLINGVSDSNSYYLVNGEDNSVSLKFNKWSLDSISNAKFAIIDQRNIRVTLDANAKGRNVLFYFSKKRIIKHQRNITVLHGLKSSPIFRVYPSKKEFTFDDLKFFKISAVNIPESPEIVEYHILKFSGTINSHRFHLEGNRFSDEFIDSLYNAKVNEILIDSVYLTNNYGNKINCKTEIKLTILNSVKTDLKCNETKKIYDFHDLRVQSKNSIITIEKDTNYCDILSFFKLGTISTVVIRNDKNDVISQKNIYIGEKSIENYFSFSGISHFFIEISGDYIWKGEVLINDFKRD